MQALLSHPRLMDCRRLFLSNYEVYINIGVHDFEKRGEQRVLINVDLFVPLVENTPSKDSLDEVVDYDFMRQSIIAKIMLAHPNVRAVKVSTAKPDVYPDCEAVGVEIFLIKE